MLGNAALSAVRRGFSQAFTEMKNVDSELITVAKVTGATNAELKVMEKQAYKTASAYGVSASEYLSSVAAFARAGYKDAAESLAELAVKTQLVFDTNQQTANQFLLSVDAAYKYGGSIEKLGRVLDGVNEIENNFATSGEKITEGMGVVSSTAAAPKVWLPFLPTPEANIRGSRPMTIAREVIKIGRRRAPAPKMAEYLIAIPVRRRSRANCTIRMAFFANRPINIINEICM